MISRCLIVFIIGLAMNNSYSQNNIFEIWGDNIPNSKETPEIEITEVTDIKRISLVKKPTLEVFLPTKQNATGKAVIICPGGGYKVLCYDWEGTDIAKWFNSKGVAAFVLKSRLPLSKSLIVPHEAPLQDAQRAIRWVRQHAEEYNVNPNKIGIMGFSAGGHLASTLGVQFDTPNNFKEASIDTISARPDFTILIYPVVTMKDNFTHKGSQNNLLGKDASDALKKKYSNELQVTENTPPTFIIHSGDDSVVPVENSLQLYKALKDKGVSSEMHIYPYGGHGFGLALENGYLQTWPDRLFDWMKSF
ncbi:alpha/beta hydrolase [Tamlana sp. 2_MG-2023]|uniref:alpha/beta hydrolase n=1 Tax=unclassified Tamlana TaxID=2614803 RepID=UPI0026E3A7E4|nr:MULTISPECIES: alpha/beta hydrolase [unclassified Tamlana]MDO6760698.1 alpha/beta hydrolase [Tamlana sp. 2_MG-2023]MDO6790954.1 alpha/beta hydrolase [Tamlana sp. 1_MG-2023]